MAVPDLDRWIDDSVVRTRQSRDAPVAAPDLWAAAGTVRLKDCRVLGRLIPARIAGVAVRESFDELFRSPPFVVLETGATFRLSGLCGRIWRVRGQFAPLPDPEAFLSWREPGTVRVLFANWAQPTEHGAALISEVRVAAVDGRARLYMRGLAPFISAFQGFVAAEPLTIAAQRAIRAAR